MHSSLKCIVLSSKLFKFPNILIFSFQDEVHIFADQRKRIMFNMFQSLGKYKKWKIEILGKEKENVAKNVLFHLVL